MTRCRRRILPPTVQPGQFHLPEQVFHYWDTQNHQVSSVSLAAVDIDAGQGMAAEETQPVEIRIQLRWLLPPLLLLLAAWLLRRRNTPGIKPKQLLQAANRALRRGQREQAARLLYDWLNSERPGSDWLSLRHTAVAGGDPELATTIEELLHAVYGGEAEQLLASKTNLASLRAPVKPARFWQRLLAKPARPELNPGSNAGVRKASGSR